MTTFTLKDLTPTKTFTFDALIDYTYHLDNRKLTPIGYPDNEGQEVITLGMWFESYKFFFQLKDDSNWPSSGESAADKWEDLRTWIKTGGDNEGIFTITFPREDSKSGTPVSYTFDGAVKHLHKKSTGGEDIVTIDGDFEFYIDNITNT